MRGVNAPNRNAIASLLVGEVSAWVGEVGECGEFAPTHNNVVQ